MFKALKHCQSVISVLLQTCKLLFCYFPILLTFLSPSVFLWRDATHKTSSLKNLPTSSFFVPTYTTHLPSCPFPQCCLHYCRCNRKRGTTVSLIRQFQSFYSNSIGLIEVTFDNRQTLMQNDMCECSTNYCVQVSFYFKSNVLIQRLRWEHVASRQVYPVLYSHLTKQK